MLTIKGKITAAGRETQRSATGDATQKLKRQKIFNVKNHD
jgi:hypothetical protein